MGHEKKLLESLGVTLTNKRVVFRNEQFSLDDIAGAFIIPDPVGQVVLSILAVGAAPWAVMWLLSDFNGGAFLVGLVLISIGIFVWYTTKFPLYLRLEGSEVVLCTVGRKEERELEKLRAAITKAALDRHNEQYDEDSDSLQAELNEIA